MAGSNLFGSNMFGGKPSAGKPEGGGGVKSSMFKSVKYEGGVLSVELHSGAAYHHEGVPAETHAAMMSAPSMGAFYNAQIKPKHPHRK